MVLESIQGNLFFDIGIIIILATILLYISRLFKQPAIPAYLIAGIILGPLGFALIKDLEIIKSLAEIGIAFLLFIVGMEIDIKKLKSVGLLSIFVGSIQVALTFLIGYAASSYFGFDQITSFYMGLVLAFSSTMVVIKLLSDKEELDTLHGRIVIGILIMQDILVIMALSALSSLDNLNFFTSAITLLKAVALFIFVILVTRYVLGGLFRFAAKFRELLFLSSITLAFVFSLISFGMGFSISIGAFLAGVALANLPYNYDIIGRIRPLKDFFSTIFFVTLGMQLVPINFNLTYILVFIGIVLLIKPLILMILISLFGYEKRIAFISSISLAQVSEFSLIMVSLGFYTYNIISQEFFSLVVFITIITMLLTSYIMKGDKFLYQHMSKWLTIFEKLNIDKKILGYQGKVKKKDILIIGAHRMGILFVKALKDMKRNFLVLDNNPEIIEELKKDKINSVYGDVTNYDVLDKMKLKNVKLIISTIPSLDDNKFLINYVKENQLRAKVMVHTTHLRDALDLYNMGANYVILPHISTGEAMTALVKKVIKDSTLLKKVKEKHIKHLTSLDHMHY